MPGSWVCSEKKFICCGLFPLALCLQLGCPCAHGGRAYSAQERIFNPFLLPLCSHKSLLHAWWQGQGKPFQFIKMSSIVICPVLKLITGVEALFCDLHPTAPPVLSQVAATCRVAGPAPQEPAKPGRCKRHAGQREHRAGDGAHLIAGTRHKGR